jgi:hypothetical protein
MSGHLRLVDCDVSSKASHGVVVRGNSTSFAAPDGWKSPERGWKKSGSGDVNVGFDGAANPQPFAAALETIAASALTDCGPRATVVGTDLSGSRYSGVVAITGHAAMGGGNNLSKNHGCTYGLAADRAAMFLNPPADLARPSGGGLGVGGYAPSAAGVGGVRTFDNAVETIRNEISGVNLVHKGQTVHVRHWARDEDAARLQAATFHRRVVLFEPERQRI